MRRSAALLVFTFLSLWAADRATALDRLCDTRSEDCRAPLLALINKEPAGGGIDVAFWFMTDDWYRSALQAAHNRGVRVRILMDPRANASKAGNEAMLDRLKLAGIPMRYKVERSWSDILHWKMMFFEKGSGKPVVEFSAANYTPDSFVPNTPYQNYIDEVVYFSDDPRLTSTFATKFEDHWTDTTGNFKDFANVAPPYARFYPVVNQDPALNFPPTQDYAVKATTHYGREPAGVNGGKIDVIMYRMSDAKHADAMISAVNRGIPVRLITEQENYRDTRYIWHSYNADRMWAAGVDVKSHVGGKQGINHQKSVILYGQKEVIFGSSNWSSASSNQQLEHNLFSRPCTSGQATWCDGPGPNNDPANPPNWFFNFFVQQFEDKWNSVNPTGFVEFTPFRPLPGGSPVNLAPANGVTGLGSSVVLKWDGGNWNHKYDVYLGPTPTLTAAEKIASDIMVGSPYMGDQESWTTPATVQLLPGTTYYWRVVGKTMAESARSADAGINLAKPGPVWSFTTAGSAGGTTAAPFPGPGPMLPAKIEVENFDSGGPGIGYVDTTAGNSGNAYRTGDSVDIGPTTDTGGGHYVGWTKSGEWMQYTVDIPTTGTYTLNVRVANTVSGGTFRVEVNGQNKTGALAVPPTGGYQTWQTVTKTGIALTAGAGQVVRLVMESQAANGGNGNFNWLEFTAGAAPPPPPPPGPYGGTRVSLPAGTIQAENFDDGGSGSAYFDTTSGNTGNVYRIASGDNVDIGAKAGGGFYVGWTRPGEWLKYSVDVTTGGTYTLDVSVANKGPATTFHVEVDGANLTGPVTVPDTGDWQRWQVVSTPGLSLTPGPHELRLVFDPGTPQNGGNVDYLRLQPAN
jgi:HKD family nuclease